MANANSTASVKSVENLRDGEYWWGMAYKGTDSAFIEAGLLKPEWFSGIPGRIDGFEPSHAHDYEGHKLEDSVDFEDLHVHALALPRS
jgi:hypothetical protein